MVTHRLGKKTIFLWTLNFENTDLAGKKTAWITTNLKLRESCISQRLNPHAFFFFLLTGATRYYHAIHIVLTYFASFTGYEDDNFEVISNLRVQGSKFGKKNYNFGEKSFPKLNSA